MVCLSGACVGYFRLVTRGLQAMTPRAGLVRRVLGGQMQRPPTVLPPTQRCTDAPPLRLAHQATVLLPTRKA